MQLTTRTNDLSVPPGTTTRDHDSRNRTASIRQKVKNLSTTGQRHPDGARVVTKQPPFNRKALSA
jgi:hypothetical protein